MTNKIKGEKWKLTRVNDWYSMTRPAGLNIEVIEVRPLNLFEKVRYFYKIMMLPKSYKTK